VEQRGDQTHRLIQAEQTLNPAALFVGTVHGCMRNFRQDIFEMILLRNNQLDI